MSVLEAERLARIIEIQQAIATTSLDMEQVIAAVLSGAQALTRAEGVGLVLRDGIDFPLRGATSTGPARSAARVGVDEPSLMGECLRTGRVLRCDDTETDPRVHRGSARASGTRSILYMPVVDGADVVGVVGVLSGRPHAFTEQDERSLTLVAGLLSAAIARAAAFEANQALLAERTAALAERDEAERTRRQLEQQLLQAQKLEAIGQLAAGIAHEINTPAQYVGDNLRFVEQALGDTLDVIASLQRVRDACAGAGLCAAEVTTADAVAARADLEFLAAELPAAIRQALEGTERIAEIVRGMKAFSPATPAGALTPADLNQQLEAAIVVSRNEWTYVADVVRDFDPSLPLVHCRVGEINQVLLNIIVNAAQAIAAVQRGGDRPRGEIRVTSRRDGPWVEVRIADTGGGIAPEVRSRIFDPFFTTRAVGQGTGQGLAIAHGVVERHGGSIGFDTELGVGTTFVVRLPIAGPGARGEPAEGA